MRITVEDIYQVSPTMSGKAVVWEVQAVGKRDVKISGVWLRRAQVERWIRQGQLTLITRESAQGSL